MERSRKDAADLRRGRPVAMTDAEYAAAEEAARADGASFSGYIRRLVTADLAKRAKAPKKGGAR